MQKVRFDRARAAAKRYQEEDIAMVLKTYFSATEWIKKLLPQFKGPFKIRKVLYNDRYEVEDIREGMKRLKTVVAVDKLKPWMILKGKSKVDLGYPWHTAIQEN